MEPRETYWGDNCVVALQRYQCTAQLASLHCPRPRRQIKSSTNPGQRLRPKSLNRCRKAGAPVRAPMSVLGHSRRVCDVCVTSVLPPKADIHRKDRHVSNVPRTDIGQALAANKSHRPGNPFSSYEPRSENLKPAPATRSVTTLESNTSLDWDCAMTRAAA